LLKIKVRPKLFFYKYKPNYLYIIGKIVWDLNIPKLISGFLFLIKTNI